MPPADTKFEYQIIPSSDFPADDVAAMTDKLRDLGDAGWELVAVTQADAYRSQTPQYIFKRAGRVNLLAPPSQDTTMSVT